MMTKLTSLATSVFFCAVLSASGPDAKLVNGTNAILASSATVANVVVLGDSTNVCSQSDCVVGPTSGSNLATAILQAYLQSQHGNHGSGVIPLDIDGGARIRALWTTSGTLLENNVGPYQTIGYAGGATLSCGTGCTASLASQPATAFRIYGFTASDSQPCQVSIDGSNVGTFGGTVTGSVTLAAQTYTTTAGIHALSLQFPSSGHCYIYGAEAINGSVGVSIHDMARGRFTSTAFGGDTASQLGYINLITGGVQMAVIDLGLNDLNSSVTTTATQYQTNIQNIVNYLKGLNANISILLINPWLTSISGNPNLSAAQIKTALTSIASSNANVALYDMTTRTGWSGGYVAAQTAGFLTSDGVHETDKGGQDFGVVYEQEIVGAEEPYLNSIGSVITPTTGRLYVNTSSSNGATIGFNSLGITSSHEWDIGSQAGGTFNFYDNTAGANALSIAPNSGSGSTTQYNLNLSKSLLLAWGSAGVGTTDSWLGRSTTGLLYIAGTGVTGGTINTRTTAAAPTTSTSTNCVLGQTAATTSYIYYCDSTNHWVRSAAASF